MEEGKTCVEMAPATCPQDAVDLEPSPSAESSDEVTNYLKGWSLVLTTFASVANSDDYPTFAHLLMH